MATFYGSGSIALRLQSHFEKAVYFLPLSSQRFLVFFDQPQKDESLSRPKSCYCFLKMIEFKIKDQRQKCSWGSEDPVSPLTLSRSSAELWWGLRGKSPQSILRSRLKNICRGKWEFSLNTWLPQFWELTVPQLHAKYETHLLSQSWEKCCRNGRTEKLSHFV